MAKRCLLSLRAPVSCTRALVPGHLEALGKLSLSSEILARFWGRAEIEEGYFPHSLANSQVKNNCNSNILPGSHHRARPLSNPVPASLHNLIFLPSILPAQIVSEVLNFPSSIPLWEQPTPTLLKGLLSLNGVFFQIKTKRNSDVV